MAEVSTERFEDFKTEVRNSFADVKTSTTNSFNDLKETLGSRIDMLTGEIKAYNQLSNSHSQKIVGLEKDVEDSKKHIEQLQEKYEDNALEINTLKSQHKTTQSNLKIILTIAGLIFTAISLIIKFFPIGG